MVKIIKYNQGMLDIWVVALGKGSGCEDNQSKHHQRNDGQFT